MFQSVRQARFVCVSLVLFVLLCFSGCAGAQTENIYALAENWAYLETEVTGKSADVFFVCPTVYEGDAEHLNMLLTDTETKASFLGATNMEKGIYDEDCRFFAPYYRQAALKVYEMDIPDREQYLLYAYEDVKQAFEYYMQHYNQGRPLVLAGFSQGADLCIRLLKDNFAEEAVNDLLVACYAIGWRVTPDELAAYDHLKFAQGETDTGVIISFNSEAESVTDSLMIPEGTTTLAINPLNWKTDGTVADQALNIGACFTDYEGTIVREIPHLTGAYIDEARGALKVCDVAQEEYPPVLTIFDSGIYHLYDYQFFYRNLQENVAVRIAQYWNEKLPPKGM